MTNLDILTYGFAFVSEQGAFGWSTLSLVTAGGQHILIDTGSPARRPLLYQALRSRNLGFEDIDIVILTHLHWDHCLNTDLFRDARILLHPKELDYARSPNRGDLLTIPYIADMLGKMNIEPVSDGDTIVDGVSIVDTPGHTKGHISVLVEVGDDKILVAGDALPDSGTVKRGKPYNIFWDVGDATESVQKMLDTSRIFYPGHDRPLRLDGERVDYLHGPSQVEVSNSNEGGGVTALSYKVYAQREPNIDLMQKG